MAQSNHDDDDDEEPWENRQKHVLFEDGDGDFFLFTYEYRGSRSCSEVLAPSIRLSVRNKKLPH